VHCLRSGGWGEVWRSMGGGGGSGWGGCGEGGRNEWHQHWDLVKEFSPWVIAAYPDVALDIFLPSGLGVRC
jgi:hypothetical protein